MAGSVTDAMVSTIASSTVVSGRFPDVKVTLEKPCCGYPPIGGFLSGHGLPGWVEEAQANGQDRGLGAVVDVELGEQPLHVGLGGGRTDPKPIGDLAVAEPLGDEQQDFVLARAQGDWLGVGLGRVRRLVMAGARRLGLGCRRLGQGRIVVRELRDDVVEIGGRRRDDLTEAGRQARESAQQAQGVGGIGEIVANATPELPHCPLARWQIL